MDENGDFSIHLPDKFYFKIGEVSRIAQVPPHVLRFWESEFTKIRPKRTESGHRLYRRRDVETILFIKYLLYQRKFTIPGARQYLSRLSSARPPDSGEDSLEEIRNELKRLRDMLR